MKIANLLIPVTLISALSLNGALTLAGWKAPSSLDENRNMAQFPEWSGDVSDYVGGLDSWLTDNFAFRKPLVKTFNEVLYYGFRSTFARGVVIGSGPWIFGATFDGQGTLAPEKLSPEYIGKVRRALTERRAWLKARGIDMLVIFMPIKSAIYGDRYLPKSWRFPPGLPFASEQIYDALSSTMPESVVSVKGAMLEASKSEELYYHTDPHATQFGTFIAAQEMVKHIQQYFPDKAPSSYPPYSLKLDHYEPTAYGRLMGLPFRDESLVPVPDGGYRFTSPTSPAWASLAPEGARTTYYENTHVRKITAALMGDSFTNRMAAIFGETFSQSITVNLNNVANTPDAKFPIDMLNAYRPDFAVFLYSESRLVDCNGECSEFPLGNPERVEAQP